MSVVYNCKEFAFISHEQFIDEVFKNVSDNATNKTKSFVIKKELFHINKPFGLRKKKVNSSQIIVHPNWQQFVAEVKRVQELFSKFQSHFIFKELNVSSDNLDAVNAAGEIYKKCEENPLSKAYGGNNSQDAITVKINDANYLIPCNCQFYCQDVINMEKYLTGDKYDLILLDPPWWNKFIRRKRIKSGHGYKMIYDEEVKKLPVEKLIKTNGLVVVWCTNSLQHFLYLIDEIFPKWNIDFIGKWYWIKVTKSIQPICSFSDPPGKQPFEQIIFGSPKGSSVSVEDKLVVSIPSAIHSHKPPLTELLMPLLPENPKCLEIFARYLLPNWTSYGLEAIKLQHESLFKEVT